MNKDFNNSKELDDEINGREVIGILWLNKKFIAICTTLVASVSVLYSLSLTNIYTAQTLITPTTSSGSNLLSQYSSLASMAGVKLPQGESKNQLDVALNLIKSKKLLDKLMLYESFLPDLLAAKSWSIQTNTVSYDEALYDKKK